jgi:hypothetical protein
MKTENKLTDNELIAEFMGFKSLPGKPYRYFNPDLPKVMGFNETWSSDEMRWKFNWQWLMPVVEKIESMGHTVLITGDSCDISLSDGEGEYMNTISEGSKIESVYYACVSCASWYASKK